MSEEPTGRVPGPDEDPSGAEGFAVAEEIARSEALAQASAGPAQDAHAAHAAEHAAAAADHSPDPSPGDDVEGLLHADDGHDAHDAHGADAGHGDGHGHGGPALGPIDWKAYGAGLVGAALGLVVAAVLAVTTGYIVL
jgi:hypothetical protein